MVIKTLIITLIKLLEQELKQKNTSRYTYNETYFADLKKTIETLKALKGYF